MKITDIVPQLMIDNENIIWYCSRCLALDIRVENGVLFCPHCFKRKNPSTVDFTTWDRWEELYMEKYGHPLVEKTSIYDDLKDTYDEEAVETMSVSDAIDNNLIVRDKMNLNLNRLKE